MTVRIRGENANRGTRITYQKSLNECRYIMRLWLSWMKIEGAKQQNAIHYPTVAVRGLLRKTTALQRHITFRISIGVVAALDHGIHSDDCSVFGYVLYANRSGHLIYKW